MKAIAPMLCDLNWLAEPRSSTQNTKSTPACRNERAFGDETIDLLKRCIMVHM